MINPRVSRKKKRWLVYMGGIYLSGKDKFQIFFIQDMMIEVDASSTGTFRFPNFLALMARFVFITKISLDFSLHFRFRIFLMIVCLFDYSVITCLFRKIDENSVEGEIRESFSVFDTVQSLVLKQTGKLQ